MGDIKVIPDAIIKINRDTLVGFLKIVNTSLERKAFKIKTTRPKDYIVKPSIGIIQPNEILPIEVNILELIKIDETHKFAIEIYDINWRQNSDTIKKYLKTTQINPLIIHRLSVQYEISSNLQVPLHNVQESYLSYLCLTYLAIILAILFFQLCKDVDI